MVKAVRTADPDVSPEQCLEAVEKAFGSAETAGDLYFAFRLLQQQLQESVQLSEAIRSITEQCSELWRY